MLSKTDKDLTQAQQAVELQARIQRGEHNPFERVDGVLLERVQRIEKTTRKYLNLNQEEALL